MKTRFILWASQALIIYGIWMWSRPAAFIYAGALLAAIVAFRTLAALGKATNEQKRAASEAAAKTMGIDPRNLDSLAARFCSFVIDPRNLDAEGKLKGNWKN